METKPVDEIGRALTRKLASRDRRVRLLLGAGASVTCGLPDMPKLAELVAEGLVGTHADDAKSLIAERGLEGALSRLARLTAALEESEEVGGFDAAAFQDIHDEITARIVEIVSRTPASTTTYDDLAVWLASDYYATPIEVFTLNYDVLLENSLERFRAPYFDGFVGYFRGRFRQDLVDRVIADRPHASARINVWKLHGSISWQTDEREVVRVAPPVNNGRVATIYPSDEKYADTRRAPYVALMDHLRRALAEPQALTVVAGYGFGDDHVNMVLFDAARANPHAEILVTCFDAIPPNLLEVALAVPTITAIGRQEAVIGGAKYAYVAPHPATGVAEAAECRLGDFNELTSSLARTRRPGDDGADPATPEVRDVVPR